MHMCLEVGGCWHAFACRGRGWVLTCMCVGVGGC